MNDKTKISGYGTGDIKTIISVDDVIREVQEISANKPTREELLTLVGQDALIELHGLHAGYGKIEIIHGLDLFVGQGQALCLIGPNGAGKSTVLHSIYGFTTITAGTIHKNGQDITRLTSNQKLKNAKIAYILQDSSIFPDMSVEENLLMGGFLLTTKKDAQEATESIFDKYPRLKERRRQRAGTLSGGERRLLEISRALIMDPDVLLIDEPSIGLEPRYIDSVFAILHELRETEKKTIILVEQNAKKALEFSDIAYVLVSGQLAIAGPADEILKKPEVGRLFLGG